MAVAWRRFEELPPGRGDHRAWLFSTARNLLLRDTRDESRRWTLAVLIAPSQPWDVPGIDGEASARVDLGRAWRLLSESHVVVGSLRVLATPGALQAP